MTIDDVDFVEINEAFVGHPFGMTGARIIDVQYGIESMRVAGGMGMAMLVERLS